MTQFEDLNLIEPLLQGVRQEGYSTPTPIQQQAIPHVLAGRDLMGCAQTGTGKTAAFALPILQRLVGEDAQGHHKGAPRIRALVLAPTRELATQIGESFRAYGRHTRIRHATIYGGVGQGPQVTALQKGIDVLVATPGRLLDLIGQGYVKLDHVEVFVLDEADRMLDMGFIHDVERIVRLVPRQRQTLMFSATMPPDILKLAREILTDPVSVSVTPAATTVELTEQRVYPVEKGSKPALLQHLLSDPQVTRALVFTRTKHGANKVVRQLGQARISAEPIHSNKSQTAREKALANFKAGRTRVLVATDIAARGIDVDNITHVINFDLPNEPETYVHRIGRTGRAGATGMALSFVSSEERDYLRDIEKLIRQRIEVVRDHPYVSGSAAAIEAAAAARSERQAQHQARSSGSGRPNGSHQTRAESAGADGSARENGQGDRRRRRRRRGGASSPQGVNRGNSPRAEASEGRSQAQAERPGSKPGEPRHHDRPGSGPQGQSNGGRNRPHSGGQQRSNGGNGGQRPASGKNSGNGNQQVNQYQPTTPAKRPRLVR